MGYKNMANLKLLLLSIFLIFTIMTSSITAEEAAAAPTSENKAEASPEKDASAEVVPPEGEQPLDEGHAGDEDFGEGNPDEASGNILDEAGKDDLKNLGFDTKEFLTQDEMLTLYRKVLLKEEITDPEEKTFYEKLIEKVMKEVPERVNQADIRNFFDIPFLMKYVDQSQLPPEQGEEMPDEPVPEGAKEDM